MNPQPLHSVLIVDDSLVHRQHGEMLCRQLGIDDITFATDGISALQLLDNQAYRPDFMIVDLEMPKMDGVELIQEITRRQIGMEVIIASAREVSLLSTVESMGKALGTSMLGALQKPLSLDSLAFVLDKRGLAQCKPYLDESTNQPLDTIQSAIHLQEFICYFQPKISVATGQIKGVEALARWQHPQKGLLFPNSFIRTIEDHEALMQPFTLNLLDHTLLHLKKWHDNGMMLSASLNMSASSFCDLSFMASIIAKVEDSRIDPAYIIFEVTETKLMKDLGNSLGSLARLRLKGFGLSIDDYGTGFSSLQQLSKIPATELKIDRAFVHDVHRQKNLRIILEGAVEMGRKMSLSVVAEGVEQMEDWRVLEELGCELAQGYIVAKPMAGHLLSSWIENDLSTIYKNIKGHE